MSDWNVRLAEPADAQAFADWAAHNTHIDPADLKAGMLKTNPTMLTFVAEKDGKVVWFAPVYMSAVVAHLCPNPEATSEERKEGLGILKDGAAVFYAQFGVREILTLSEPKYFVAAWAQRNGFDADPRSLYRLDLNKEMGIEA